MKNDSYTILVMEDEEDSLFLYADYLSEAGFNVLTAASCAQALSILAEEKVDLVVADIMMPDMHAVEMIDRLRPKHPSLPIVIVTAYKGMEHDFKLRELHTDTFFFKPVDLEALKDKILEMLGATGAAV